MQNAEIGTRLQRSVLTFMAALAAIFCCRAHADTVTLTNDKVLEGKVTDDGVTVTIEMSRGTVKVPKSKVKSIVIKDTPQDEYNRRAAEILNNEKAGKLEALPEADAWYELSEWAEKKDLVKARREALQKALELNPDHAAAREASGFVFYDHRWMTQAERYQAMGFVHVDGKWLPPEALQDASRARDEQRAREERDEQVRADTALKDAQARKLDAETQLLQARIEREQAPPVVEAPPVVLQAPAQVIFLPFPYRGINAPPYAFRPPPPPFLPAPPVQFIDPNRPPIKKKPHEINSTLNDGKSGPGMPVLP
jgi:hypothetical protein